MRADTLERLATLLSAGRAVHDPSAAGSLMRTGSRRVYVRVAWEGPRPRRLWLWYDDGALRRRLMVCTGAAGGRWEYVGRVDLQRPAFSYQLEAHLHAPGPEDEAVAVWFGPETQAAPAAGPAAAGRWRADADAVPMFAVPPWVPGATIYQIFPDRFFNGRADNDPPGTRPWGEPPTVESFFGGDLDGVRRRLDYLAALGIGAIYLNPIVPAPSNHRYDASDYMAVDPALGTVEDFRRLVEEAHRRGIRVILDAVFNHTGESFWAFRDVVERGPASPYFRWYHVHQWPIRREPPSYACWWNLPHLPKLDTANPEVRAYLFEVTRFWMEMGIDGWRLDVPNELAPGFWVEWRRLVKRLKPDIYIVGEIWHDAAEWLQGDQFDGVMNYPLRDALVAFFVHRTLDGAGLAERLEAQACRYPVPALHAMMNLLGSHDTERVMTVAGGDREAVQGMMLMAAAWPGALSVYYGDEVGMTGGKDPDCRRCFPWDERHQDVRLWRYVRALVRARRTLPALADGEVAAVRVEGSTEVAAVGRLDPWRSGQGVLAVASRSSRPETVVVDPGEEMARCAWRPGAQGAWVDYLSGRVVRAGRRLRLELAPRDRMLLVPSALEARPGRAGPPG